MKHYVDVLVGVDLGTSSFKAVAIDLHGERLAHASVPTPWGANAVCMTELNPKVVTAEVVGLIRKLSASQAEESHMRVAGIGLAGMAETGLLVAQDGRPASAIIGWRDRRSAESAESLSQILGADEFMSRSGRRLDALPPIGTYAWLRENGLAGNAGERWLSLPEWLAVELGADVCAEPSLSSRTGFLDVVTGEYWSEAIDAVGGSASLLPPLRQGTQSWGISEVPPIAGAHVTVAGHDHLAAAIGAGAVGREVVFDSCGTAEAYVGTAAIPNRAEMLAYVRGGGTVSRHILPGSAAVFAPTFRTGEALSRVLGWIRVDLNSAVAVEELRSRAAGRSVPVLPWLLGAQPPDGIARLHPADVWLAALDQSSRLGVERIAAMSALTGSVQRVVAAGGWLDDLALKSKQAHLPGEVVATRGEWIGARGAALVAGVAAGWFAGLTKPQCDDPHYAANAHQEGVDE